MKKPSKTIWFSKVLIDGLSWNPSVQDILNVCNRNNISDFENVKIDSDEEGRISISYEKQIENPDLEEEMNTYYAFCNTSKEKEETRKREAKAAKESLTAKKQWKEKQRLLRESKHIIQ